MRKKLLIATIMSLLALTAVFMLTACGEHVHEWGEWTTVTPPGCTTEGTKERTCPGCDEKETETIPATGHTTGSWRHDAEKHWKPCLECDERITESAHTFGATDGTCSVCGYVDENLPMPGVVQATAFDVEGSAAGLRAEQKGPTEAPGDGSNIGAIQDGNYALYKNLEFGRTPTKLKVCYSGEGNKMIFRLGNAEGAQIAEVKLPKTAAADCYDVYATEEFAVSYEGDDFVGTLDIYVELYARINFAWFEFV